MQHETRSTGQAKSQTSRSDHGPSTEARASRARDHRQKETANRRLIKTGSIKTPLKGGVFFVSAFSLITTSCAQSPTVLAPTTTTSRG